MGAPFNVRSQLVWRFHDLVNKLMGMLLENVVMSKYALLREVGLKILSLLLVPLAIL